MPKRLQDFELVDSMQITTNIQVPLVFEMTYFLADRIPLTIISH